MRGLKARFFFWFVGLSILVSMGVGHAKSDVYFGLLRNIKSIADEFLLDTIYYISRDGGGGYRFVFDTLNVEAGAGKFDEAFLAAYTDYPKELDMAYSTGALQMTAPYTDEYGSFISAYLPLSNGGKVADILGAEWFRGDSEAKRLNPGM